MARTKIKDELVLKSWDDVDLALKEVAEDEMEIEKIQTEMNQQIHDIKLEADMKAKVHQANIEMLGMHIKQFVDENKVELDGKTKQLNFGKIGFRLSTKLTLKNVANVLSNLKQYGMEDCITTKESVNKDALKKYDEEDIIKVGASLKKQDTFWYETEREKLQ